MAKRRKKEEEEDDIFEWPEFDEIEYMKEEIKKGKSVLFTIAIAPIFSYLSMQVFLLTEDWTYGFLVGIFGMLITFKLFEYVRIDISDFGKKEWALDGAMYLFTWIAIWIVLMNPPFHDFAAPTLNDFEIEVDLDGDGNYTLLEDAQKDGTIENGEDYDIRVIATVTDNVEVSSVEIMFNTQQTQMDRIDEHQFMKEFEGVTAGASEREFILFMEDVNGNSSQETVEVIIGER